MLTCRSDLQANRIVSIPKGVFSPAVTTSLQHLSMAGNPSECFLGVSLAWVPSVFCSCGAPFVAVSPDYCVDVADVLIGQLPSAVATYEQYALQIPAGVALDSTCGPIHHHALTVNATAATCTISSNGTVLWTAAVVSPAAVFSQSYVPLAQTLSLSVGAPAHITVPGRSPAVVQPSDNGHIDYVSLQALPAGLRLDPRSGVIDGVPEAVFASQLVVIALQDQFTRLRQPMLLLTLTVHEPVLAPSNGVSPAAIAVPIVVGVALIVLLVLLIRYNRRKIFHIFISYRALTDSKLAETLCEKLQHHFLSTGHRVRSAVATATCTALIRAASSSTRMSRRTPRTGSARSMRPSNTHASSCRSSRTCRSNLCAADDWPFRAHTRADEGDFASVRAGQLPC